MPSLQTYEVIVTMHLMIKIIRDYFLLILNNYFCRLVTKLGNNHFGRNMF